MSEETDFYSRIAEQWDKMFSNKAGKYFRYKKHQTIKESINKKGSIVDVGCATGYITKFLSDMGMSVIGLDYSENMIKLCRSKYPTLDFRCCKAEEMSSVVKEKVDYISMSGLLSRENYKNVLFECNKILKNRGKIIITTSNGDVPVWTFYNYFHREVPSRNFNQSEISSILLSYGYTVVRVKKFDFIPCSTPNILFRIALYIEKILETFIPSFGLTMVVVAKFNNSILLGENKNTT